MPVTIIPNMFSSINILKAVACLDLLAVGLIVPMLQDQLRNVLNGSHIQLGLLGSIYASFQLFSGPVIGSLSDLKGRKLILIVTLLVSSAAYSANGFTSSIIVMLFLRAVVGIFKQTQMLTRAMVPDYEKNEQKQGEIYGKMNAMSGTGMTLGPVIGGTIAEDYPDLGFKFITILVGLCFLTNAGLVALLPNPTVKKSKPRKTEIGMESRNIVQLFTNSLKQSFLQLYSIEWSLYGDIFMFKGLVGFAMGVYYSNYGSYLREQYNLTPKYIGYIISFQSIVGSFSSYFMGFINSFYTQDHDYSQRNFHVFLILSSALVGLILSMNIYMYAFWLIPLAVGNAIGRLTTLEMVLNRSQGKHRGTLIGASNSVRSLTGVVSPMVAGVIGEFCGVRYVIFASFFSTALGVVLSYRHKNKRLKND